MTNANVNPGQFAIMSYEKAQLERYNLTHEETFDSMDEAEAAYRQAIDLNAHDIRLALVMTNTTVDTENDGIVNVDPIAGTGRLIDTFVVPAIADASLRCPASSWAMTAAETPLTTPAGSITLRPKIHGPVSTTM